MIITSNKMKRSAVLIAGPTASGKSALALEKARQNNGVIVNADSMQVYAVLNLLSARPQAEELNRATHVFYGEVAPSVRFSTGMWMEKIKQVMCDPAYLDRDMIFVGGTGLYFQTLESGLSPIPNVPAEIVEKWNVCVADLDRDERRVLLARHDPQMVEQLSEPDPQRLVRALSVKDHSGRSLAEWQSEHQPGLLAEWQVERIVLNPPRELLRDRIAQRFNSMLDQGAVAEVEQLLTLDLDPSLPAMKAIGVREIRDWLAGNISKDAAAQLAITATHQYAKRQRTWYRSHMADWNWHTNGTGEA